MSVVVITAFVRINAPASAAGYVCSAVAQSSVASTLLTAAGAVTVVDGSGSQNCSAATSRRLSAADSARQMQAVCPGATTTYVFTVPVLVPPGGDAAAAQNAVLALNAASYASLISGLETASGCSNIAYVTTTTTATCGGGGTTGCALPTAASAATGACAGSNLGLCIGLPVGLGLGVIGAAAIIAYYYYAHGRKRAINAYTAPSPSS